MVKVAREETLQGSRPQGRSVQKDDKRYKYQNERNGT